MSSVKDPLDGEKFESVNNDNYTDYQKTMRNVPIVLTLVNRDNVQTRQNKPSKYPLVVTIVKLRRFLVHVFKDRNKLIQTINVLLGIGRSSISIDNGITVAKRTSSYFFSY